MQYFKSELDTLRQISEDLMDLADELETGGSEQELSAQTLIYDAVDLISDAMGELRG